MAMAYIKLFFDWMDVTSPLTSEEKGRLVDALILHAKDGSGEELLTGNERYTFPVLRRRLDNDARRYARRCAGLRKKEDKEDKEDEEDYEDYEDKEDYEDEEPSDFRERNTHWKTSIMARKSEAQRLVDHCISENLPCSGMNSLFDELLSAMEGGLSPAELLTCCQRADARSLGLEIYTAMKRRGVGVRA